jgi:tRNA modification GTPase
MPYHPDDTICAVATAPGRAARGMVRVSGPDAIIVVSQLFHVDNCSGALDRLRQPTSVCGDVAVTLHGAVRPVPCDAFVWPTHRSYTREPVVELHTFGSPPVLETLVNAVCAAGARLAEPGEFTLRAFLAGRLDLTQAEAVLGVIDARAADDLSTALNQMAGGISKPLTQLRDELLQLLAELEAGLDFVEEDIEFVSQQEIVRRLHSAMQTLTEIAGQMASRHVDSTDRQVVLFGKPNAGKSSLFNALVKRYGRRAGTSHVHSPAALVSPQRGTTRDYLTATISLGAFPCEIVDTAGADEGRDALSNTADSDARHRSASFGEIISAAKELSERQRASATIRALCIDALSYAALNSIDLEIQAADADLIVVTKGDLLRSPDKIGQLPLRNPLVLTSSLAGTGFEELCDTLRSMMSSERTAQRGQIVASTASRCHASIQIAGDAITRALELTSSGMGNELIAVELRAALHELGKVVGAVYTDDLLDRIFSTFCIGK